MKLPMEDGERGVNLGRQLGVAFVRPGILGVALSDYPPVWQHPRL
ncbi:hypothetical protein [Streptomyces rimosus]|nr:hypothetical protein [Streptomyces rimosus]